MSTSGDYKKTGNISILKFCLSIISISRRVSIAGVKFNSRPSRAHTSP